MFLLYKPSWQLNLFQIFVFDDNVFLCKRYVINWYVYDTRFTHSKIVMYITLFVLKWLTCVICDQCYIHNSVITITRKRYVHKLLCLHFCPNDIPYYALLYLWPIYIPNIYISNTIWYIFYVVTFVTHDINITVS